MYRLLITLFLFTGAMNANQARLALPDGWGCVTDEAQLPKKIRLIAIGESKGKFTPSINLATEETEQSIAEYIESAKHYHESEPNTQVTKLGFIPTKAGKAQLLQIDRKSDFGVIRFLQAALIDESIAYVITATCLKDEFPSFCKRFFDSIKSFEIEKD